ESLIGFVANTLVLRTNLTGDPSFREVLRRVRQVAVSAYENGNVPFEHLVKQLSPRRDLARAPFCQVSFDLQRVASARSMLRSLRVERFDLLDSGSSMFDLVVNVMETEGQSSAESSSLTVSFRYDSGLFDRSTIEGFATHYLKLIEVIIDRPESRLSEICVLTDTEKVMLLGDTNQSDADCSDETCFRRLFEQQVERSPDAVAVVFRGEYVSRSALNSRANQLANHLRRLGAGEEMLSGLYMERSIEMIVG
ncbi:MAG: condensation domain-containing protein, partial [Blastocatellia bacterium]